MNLSNIEALIILTQGWKNEDERQLCDVAIKTLLREKQKLVLQYKKEKTEQELFELGQELGYPPSQRVPECQMTDEEISKEAQNWATRKTTRSTTYWSSLVDAYIAAATHLREKK